MAEYATVRNDLVKNIKWLNIFEYPLEDEIRAVFAKVSRRGPRYDCYGVEQLINDVSAILDRCLVYRREYYELEAIAIKTVLDEELFTNTLSANRGIELAEHVERQRRAEQAAQILAQQEFVRGAEPLSQGFSKASEGSAISSSIAADAEMVRKNWVTEKWNRLEDYQKTLSDRHGYPGHPLNFSERAERVKRFLLDDMEEAFDKALCIDKGLYIVYGINAPFPDILVHPPLDAFVFWIRSVSRELEIQTWSEIQFEHIVYGRHGVQRPTDTKHLIQDSQYDAALTFGSQGILEYDLTTDYFDNAPHIANLRVKGLAVSMLTKNFNNPGANDRLHRFSCVVIPPNVQDPFNREEFPARSPIIIENIAVTDPANRVQFASPPSLINIPPAGTWTVQVSTNIGNPDLKVSPKEPWIQDIKLHLLLAGAPVRGTRSWLNFWW